MLPRPSSAARLAPWVLLAVAAMGVAAWRIGPLSAGQVGYDSAASVLYFQRILAGQRLEAFVSATPKALLTVVDGSLFALTHDWRSISVVAIAVYGLNVALGAALAGRLGGPLAAGFAAVGLVGSSALLDDASMAYAVGPALLGWLVAGLALTEPRKRYGLAGIALLLAGLARFETILFAAPVLAALVGGLLLGRSRPTLRPPRAAWLLLLVVGAWPLQALHDWLLAGDPFWAETVPVLVSGLGPVAAPLTVARMMISHYSGLGMLVILAVPAVAGLVARRRLVILAGLAVLGPGILVFLLLLAIRHVYVSSRYLYPTDIALVLTAALGLTELRSPILQAGLGAITRRLQAGVDAGPAARRLASAVLPVAVGGIVAFAAVRPYSLLDPALTLTIRSNHALFANEQAALPALRAAVAGAPGAHALPAHPSPRLQSPPGATILAPLLLGPRLSVDLGIPVNAIAGSDAARVGTGGTYPAPGQLVYHDPRNDLPGTPFTFLEVDRTTTIGAIRLVPLVADPAARVWLLRVESAGSASAPAGP